MDGCYADFLQRPAGEAGRSGWLTLLHQRRLTERTLGASFLARDEYFARAANAV